MSIQTIFISSHPDIAKRLSIVGMFLSALMLMGGIFFFVLTFELQEHSSAVSMALMVTGTGFFLWGVFRLFWKTKQTIYLPTGSEVKERSVFFDLKDMEQLTQMVNTGDFSVGSNIRRAVSGNVRMDLILSADRQFAAVQLFRFVPYTYQPVTSVRYFTGGDAAAVAAFVAKGR